MKIVITARELVLIYTAQADMCRDTKEAWRLRHKAARARADVRHFCHMYKQARRAERAAPTTTEAVSQ